MRRLKHILYTVVVIAAAMYIVWAAHPVLSSWLTQASKDSKNPLGTTVALAYELKVDTWTTFPLTQGTKYIKFTTNATYFKTYDSTVKYELVFEILDSKNKVIFSHNYNLIANTRLFKKKHSSRILSNPFLINGRHYLTPNSNFIFPLDDLKNFDKLRIKWIPSQEVKNIKNVYLRISSLKGVSTTKKDILWYRFPPKTRESLAKNNFYPSTLLTNAEKQNIVNNLFSSVGPLGTEGNDYEPVRIGRMPADLLKQIDLLAGHLPTSMPKSKSKLYNIYLNSKLDGFFEPQSSKNINEAKKLFIRLFKGATTAELKDSWNKLGMNINEFKEKDKIFTIVYEQKNEKFGQGFYMFCKSDKTQNLVLEIPHRFWDSHTGEIGYKLMKSGYFMAAAWNTVQRYQTPNDMQSSSDMAHTTNSFFYAFTKAFTETMSEGSLMIQPHGFLNKIQHSHYGKKAAVVISNSSTDPVNGFIYYADLINEIMPQPTYIYPVTDIKWLAGFENVSAKTLKNARKNQIFIHLEMNDKTRLEMLNNKKLREQFINCLIEEK